MEMSVTNYQYMMHNIPIIKLKRLVRLDQQAGSLKLSQGYPE
jgi:hypothetical protein